MINLRGVFFIRLSGEFLKLPVWSLVISGNLYLNDRLSLRLLFSQRQVIIIVIALLM